MTQFEIVVLGTWGEGGGEVPQRVSLNLKTIHSFCADKPGLPRTAADLEKTGILGSWVLRNICQYHEIEEHFEQSPVYLRF